MKRREFIAGLGSAVAWPVAAWARQLERMRRIGVLIAGLGGAVAWTLVARAQQGERVRRVGILYLGLQGRVNSPSKQRPGAIAGHPTN
jgi:hypothetical protein